MTDDTEEKRLLDERLSQAEARANQWQIKSERQTIEIRKLLNAKASLREQLKRERDQQKQKEIAAGHPLAWQPKQIASSHTELDVINIPNGPLHERVRRACNAIKSLRFDLTAACESGDRLDKEVKIWQQRYEAKKSCAGCHKEIPVVNGDRLLYICETCWTKVDSDELSWNEQDDPSGINALRSKVMESARNLARWKQKLAAVQKSAVRNSSEAFDKVIKNILNTSQQ